MNVDKTALVTGGTCGLGTAVTTGLLAGGWRVVVPWIDESELERLEPLPNSALVEADLFDRDSVAEVGGSAGAPLRAVANLLRSVTDTPGNRAGQPDSSRQGWMVSHAIVSVIAFFVRTGIGGHHRCAGAGAGCR